MVFAALIGGLVGSRVDYLIQNWDKVSDDLLGNIFSGSGLVWFGGLVGGALGVILWACWRGLLGWQLFDAAAVPLALGYAIGRVGCQLSGDGDYGSRLGPAVGDGLPGRHRPDHRRGAPDAGLRDARDGPRRRWSCGDLRDRFAPGVLFGLYLVLAGLERLLVEFIRRNDDVVAGPHPAAAHQPRDDGARRRDRRAAAPRRAARGDGLSARAERGGRAERERHRGARGAAERGTRR